MAKISPEEKDFLIAEYNASWTTIQNIDNRRGSFVRIFTLICIGVYSIVAGISNAGHLETIETKYFISLLLIPSTLGAILFVGVLMSERSANIRYRKRVNNIREMLLTNSKNEAVSEYLVGETHNPKGIGKTLKLITTALYLFAIVNLAILYFIWFIK